MCSSGCVFKASATSIFGTNTLSSKHLSSATLRCWLASLRVCWVSNWKWRLLHLLWSLRSSKKTSLRVFFFKASTTVPESHLRFYWDHDLSMRRECFLFCTKDSTIKFPERKQESSLPTQTDATKMRKSLKRYTTMLDSWCSCTQRGRIFPWIRILHWRHQRIVGCSMSQTWVDWKDP